MSRARQTLRAVTPAPLIRYYHRRNLRRAAVPFADADNEQIFSTIYHGPYWGNGEGRAYSSGSGTATSQLVAPYVTAVRAFVEGLPGAPDVVDLGCGDFTVGAQVRPLCQRYVACDVVPAVVADNAERHADLDVDFRAVDMTRDPLPEGDVVFIRQVLQHLSNADIAQVVPKLAAFGHAVITEHLPDVGFTPNADMPSGPYIRLGLGSGVDLAEPPFAVPYTAREVICEVAQPHSVIRTTLYTLR